MENLTLNFSGKTPLYRQLYTHISTNIRTGAIKTGEKLPSKRRLSENLNISVNTVDTAYQMLLAEGYISSKPRSGYTVCRFERPFVQSEKKGKGNIKRGNSLHGNEQNGMVNIRHDETGEKQTSKCADVQVKYNFGTAGIDTSLFPYKTWCNLQKEVFAESPDILNHGHNHGDFELRSAISSHLKEFRGAKCEPSQIIVGAGIEYLLSLLARMFIKSTFAVENPGYNRAANILKNSGANVIKIQVDEFGMSAEHLEKSAASLAYITPSHQFPTGVTMPIGRRTALLDWARHGNGARFIIEDDYNSEFRFDGKPLPALQGLAEGENVIYISTFSKSIAPAIRIAYMALPLPLLQKFEVLFGNYSCTVSRFEQQTLYKFIKGGYFARHLARLKTQYKKRRDELINNIHKNFGPDVIIKGNHTGLHIVLQTKALLSTPTAELETLIAQTAAKRGIRVFAMCGYGENSETALSAHIKRGMVLGYGGLTPEQIPKAVQELCEVWRGAELLLGKK